MTRTLNELVSQLDTMSKAMRDDNVTKDDIDFQWMGYDDLISLALDYERVKYLDNDSKESLIYILGRRLETLWYQD